MLPTNEIDTLSMTVTEAVDLSAEGKVADGYACLYWGLRRAQVLPSVQLIGLSAG